MIGNNLLEEEKQLIKDTMELYIGKSITVDEAVEILSPIMSKFMLEHWQNNMLPKFATIDNYGDCIYIISAENKPIKVCFERE